MRFVQRMNPVHGRSMRIANVLACAAMFAVAAAGCSQPRSDSAAGAAVASADDRQPAQQTEHAPRNESSQGKTKRDEIRETWQVHYIGEAKVGYGRTRIIPQKDGLVRIESEEELTLDRGGSSVTQRVTLVSVEKADGRLVRFESRANLGPVETQSRGRVELGDKLRIENQTQGKVVIDTLDWRPEWGGFFAVERSLERDPLEPGEKRTLHALQPLVNQVGDVRLAAREFEETSLLLGTRRLLRIDGRMTVAGVPFDTTLWTDEQGETWKIHLPALQQTTYRASRELALSANETPKYDLFDDITIRLKTPLKKGHDSQRVVYRARLASGDPVEAFVSGVGQSVRRIDDRTAEITVQAVRPDQPSQLPEGIEPPSEDDLQPNSLIQSDDPHIVQMASTIAPEETDPWKIAVALEQFVHGAITEKNFSQAFATAAEVAQSREGDCTEHAVLLAGLCRARKIPARGAMGLVYFPQADGAAFAYHMWTEAWINDRWIPLDGTLGRGGVGAAHLKLAHANLKGAGPYAAFLPVFRVLGQLELEVAEQE